VKSEGERAADLFIQQVQEQRGSAFRRSRGKPKISQTRKRRVVCNKDRGGKKTNMQCARARTASGQRHTMWEHLISATTAVMH